MADKIIKLSATRINTFLQCKQKYWFNYYENLPKIVNPAFKLGLACHKALEFAGKLWMEKGKFSTSDKKKILDRYVELSVNEGIEDMDIHNEGLDLVKKRINNFEIGNKILCLEEEFGFKDNFVIANEIPLIGAIDKVIEIDSDTLLIVDYKTSKTAPTSEQLSTDIQLSIYDVVAHKKWPSYKRIILALDLLKTEMLYTYRTDEQRELFMEYLKTIYDAMCSLDKKQAKSHLNQFCGWCDFKDYCDSYKEVCSKTQYDFKPFSNYSDSELFSEWDRIKNIKRIMDARERELSMILIEKVKKDSKHIINTEGNEELYIRQNSRASYDVDMVCNAIPIDIFVKMVSLNKKKLEDYISENPTVKDKVEKALTVNFTAPFIATKKIK